MKYYIALACQIALGEIFADIQVCNLPSLSPPSLPLHLSQIFSLTVIDAGRKQDIHWTSTLRCLKMCWFKGEHALMKQIALYQTDNSYSHEAIYSYRLII